MSEAWIALIGTVFGSAGLKSIEHFLGRRERRDDTAVELRKELRQELTETREENDDLRDEVDLWRERYYSLVASVTTGDLPGALKKITENREL